MIPDFQTHQISGTFGFHTSPFLNILLLLSFFNERIIAHFVLCFKTFLVKDFKVFDPLRNDLEDTAWNALRQIEDKKYSADLVSRGIPEERILKYGFAFEGEKCLILKG